MSVESIKQTLFQDYPKLEPCHTSIEQTFQILKECYEQQHKLLLCGNGGSASDCEHITGELMKSFRLKRTIPQYHKDILNERFGESGNYLADKLQRGLEAVPLVSYGALETAIINDLGSEMVFAQQVYACGRNKDVLLCFTTSGNAKDVCLAAMVAKLLDIRVIGFTGAEGGALKDLCDCCICVPETETYRIQEKHLPIYHSLCLMLEEYFFAE